ncbi:alpha/beta fold hydrolase [Actinoplanes friuliensis]|uniref:Alpha/beta hydrolase n=1 Tax=Actinoplanes friuliensis DSM 7358 TaxID=1246995 RepID=U5W4W3_9ACTN|nr:alpha/beta hydrolase [Actinoplanes friuliensis]AGZ42981.1 alpha/beta hydrolase [Actinoplanes friuliensis DSM 7358]
MADEPTRRTIAGLTCAEWNPGGETTVLALHGLTSTSEVWSRLAAALPGARVVAPDLPGRGGSAHVIAGPGLAGHAAAVIALADDLGLRDVTVVGHSMGAFLAPLVARSLGDRVRRIVLADGGISPDPSPLLRKPVVRTIFRVQAAVLGRRWRSADALVDAIEGKAVRGRPELRPMVVEWAAYLLDEHGKARLDRRRLVADGADTLAGEPTLGAVRDLSAPVHLLAASHGAHDGSAAFLSDAALSRAAALVPRLTSERVDANHVTLLANPKLAAAVR